MSGAFPVGWSWHPSVLIGLGLWTLAYVWAIRNGPRTPVLHQVLFHLGTLAALIALVSPLDELGDEYLFSAHMAQHLLLMFAAAPLWLLGTPGWLVDRSIPGQFSRLAGWLTRPLPAFGVFMGVMYLWHVPAVYGAAQGSEALHIFEHLTFIGAALIGWWPVAGPATSRFPTPAPPIRILYLFLLGAACTAISAVLTFAKVPMYSFYVSVPHSPGLGALDDLHLGGLLMWVPTHLVLILAAAITFFSWFADTERAARLAAYAPGES
jgi:cytochrome c oxidase assembly factor CtaG